MIKQLNQSVAYICPACAAVTGRTVDIFSFSGVKTIHLSCGAEDCGEEFAYISQLNDKYKIMSECPFCGYTHEFSVKKAFFWSNDFFAFKCPVSDMNLFFLGDPDKVRDEVKKQERLLEEISREFETETEMSLMLDIVSLIDNLFKANAVVCQCGSKRININIDEGDITLTCKDCFTTMLIESTQSEYDRLKKAKSLEVTE